MLLRFTKNTLPTIATTTSIFVIVNQQVKRFPQNIIRSVWHSSPSGGRNRPPQCRQCPICGLTLDQMNLHSKYKYNDILLFKFWPMKLVLKLNKWKHFRQYWFAIDNNTYCGKFDNVLIRFIYNGVPPCTLLVD